MVYNKIENSYVGLLRKEANGVRLFYPKSYSKPHFMNQTVYEIWKLIDNRSVEEIVQIMQKKYPKITTERLLNDVENTIAYFINLEMVREVKYK